MRHHRNREDLSKFLIHLTRNCNGNSAKDNLLSILKNKVIYAKHAHCLVKYKINQMSFSNYLKQKFYTVCFTEAPLTQIKHLAIRIEGRKIQLRPFGLVFLKENLFNQGASPAIYINSKGTPISKFLLDEFNSIFKGVKTLKKLKTIEEQHYENIVHYYSLINVVNDKHDFMWEREWRHHGDFSFDYIDIMAIIAEDPESFRDDCKKNFGDSQLEEIESLPIINPNWSYEEALEQLGIIYWNKLQKN